MNAPVARLWPYASTASGSERRRRTRAMSFSSSRSGPGRSSSVWMSTTETSSSTTARTVRVVCLIARRDRGSSGCSALQQIVAPRQRALELTVGRLAGRDGRAASRGEHDHVVAGLPDAAGHLARVAAVVVVL